MTATITPPEWLTVGAKVAVVNYHGVYGAMVRFKTVERLTATTVVVGGDRYRLDRLQRSTSTYGPTFYLRDPKDPEVTNIARKTAAEQATDRLEDALKKWRQARFGPESAAVVRAALAALDPYLNPAGTEAQP